MIDVEIHNKKSRVRATRIQSLERSYILVTYENIETGRTYKHLYRRCVTNYK